MSVHLQFRINSVKELLSFILIAGSSHLLKQPLYLLMILFENLQSVHFRSSIQLSTVNCDRLEKSATAVPKILFFHKGWFARSSILSNPALGILFERLVSLPRNSVVFPTMFRRFLFRAALLACLLALWHMKTSFVFFGCGKRNYNCRMKATRSFFSCSFSFSSRIRLKNSTVSSSVNNRPSCR